MSAKKFAESVRLISVIAFVVIEAALIVEIIKAVTQLIMFRFFAKVAAKIAYRWKQEKKAETDLLNAGLASQLAQEKRELIARITKEADDMDARIKEVAEMEVKGFWICEDGHETTIHDTSQDGSDLCSACRVKPAKLIKRNQMSGQRVRVRQGPRRGGEDRPIETRPGEAVGERGGRGQKGRQVFPRAREEQQDRR